jgi:nitrite reductase (NADH) small subunit
MKWVKVTNLENIPLREGRCVKLGNHEVAIFHLPDKVLAVDNRCPHNLGPLCDGITSGTSVTCPLHGWKIDLESGAVKKPDVPLRVRTYPVRLVDGIVELNLEAALESACEGKAA